MTLAPELPGHSSSWLARRDPRWRIASLSAWAVAASLVNELAGVSIAVVGSTLLLCSARLPWNWVARRLLAVVPFLLILAIPLVAFQRSAGLRPATILLFKMLAIVLPTMILVGLTSTAEMLDAFRSMRMPGQLVSLIMLAERHGTILSTTFNRMRRSMCVRGFKWRTNRHTYRTVGIAVGSLATRGMDRTNRLSHALACRGFDGQYRSWRRYETHLSDVALLVIAVLTSISLVWYDWRFAS